MREILFRGKRLGDGEWVDGSLFIDEKKDKHEILVGYVNYRVGWEVDPKTVGQFTGLTDKNGKRIFEGDILRYDRYRYSVIFEEGAFNCDGFLDNSMDCPYCAFSQGTYHFEVIGNIHDNPELMDGKP